MNGKYMTESDGTQVYAVTHEKFVVDDDGTTLETKLEQKVSILQESPSGTSVTKNIEPNKYYVFGEVTNLTITLGTPINEVNNEYTFEFDSGNTATTLSIPASVIGVDASKIVANAHYEISIKYNPFNTNYYGLISAW